MNVSRVGTHSDLFGLFAWHHFQLDNINYGFLFALWAVERKSNKNGIRIDFDSCFAIANRAADPKGIV